MAILKLVLSAGATLAIFGLWKLYGLLYQRFTTPLRFVPGPKTDHWFYGNFGQILKAVRGICFNV